MFFEPSLSQVIGLLKSISPYTPSPRQGEGLNERSFLLFSDQAELTTGTALLEVR